MTHRTEEMRALRDKVQKILDGELTRDDLGSMDLVNILDALEIAGEL